MAVYTELSLFSGAGGGLLATKHLLGWRTVCYVEWDKYAVEVLKARIRDGYLDYAPIWDDAFTFDGRPWSGSVDIVSAGFPCQPFSVSGKGLAENDPRNGWPAVIRILREVRPRFAFLENVPGLVSKPYFRRILGDLAEAGFDIGHDCLSAAEIGAPHIRERLWIIAHAKGRDGSLSAGRKREGKADSDGNGSPRHMADTNGSRLAEREGQPGNNGQEQPATERSSFIQHAEHTRDRRRIAWQESSERERNFCCPQWWEVEPGLGGDVDGLAARLDFAGATKSD